jgi:hypothetical protein
MRARVEGSVRRVLVVVAMLGCGASPRPRPAQRPAPAAPDQEPPAPPPSTWLELDEPLAHHEPSPAIDQRAQMRPFLKQHAAAISACVPTEPMRVVIRFTVGPDGHVQRSTATGEQRHLEECIADALAGVVFPRPADGGMLIVSFPWK